MEKILKFIVVMLCLISIPAYADPDAYTLKIPLQKSNISLDPTHIQDVPSLFVSRQINCQLVRNQGSVFNLDAAKSIKYISPFKIIITLKDDAQFHDGSAVTAEDVAASFYYVKKSRTVMRNIFSWVDRIDVLDKKSVIFYLRKPIPQFLKVLSSPNYAIFKKSFLDQASVKSTLWEKPIGCGGYKITESTNKKEIHLTPMHGGLPIIFDLNSQNQISVDEMNRYDIVSLNIIGDTKKISDFNSIELFDPLQFFIGLNLNNKTWKNPSARCAFLSKLNPNELLKSYGGSANLANDLLPQGTLGYSPASNFFSKIIDDYRDKTQPKLTSFCLAYLSVSIPEKYKKYYLQMISTIYPNITTRQIVDTKQFGLKFSSQKCDALIFALKSNYLDGYEYLQIFANNDANFSGDYNKQLAEEIKNSQDVGDSYERAKAYRKIVSQVETACIIRPLITIPMRTIYVRKTLLTPGIGLGPLNEYYLGNITKSKL